MFYEIFTSELKFVGKNTLSCSVDNGDLSFQEEAPITICTGITAAIIRAQVSEHGRVDFNSAVTLYSPFPDINSHPGVLAAAHGFDY